MSRRNKYDRFIILIIATLAFGTIQIGVISQGVIVGLLCFPSVFKEVLISVKKASISSIILLIICWFLYALMSIVWTIDAKHGSVDIWLLFFNMVIFSAIFFFSKKANKPMQSIMVGWILLVAITLPVAIWEITSGNHLPWGSFNEDASNNFMGAKRIYAAVTFANLNTYVTVLCAALPLILSSTCILKYKIIPIVVSFSTIIIVLINASRGGLLCIIIDVLFFIIFYWKLKFKYKFFVSLLLIGGIVIFIIDYVDIIIEQLAFRLVNSDSLFEDASRSEVWTIGLHLIRNSIGFGYGVGAMDEAYFSTGHSLGYAHNMVLELLIQYGVIIGIYFLFSISKALFQICRSPVVYVRLYGYQTLASFIPLMIIDNSYLVRPYFWVYAATIISINAMNNKEKVRMI